MNVLYDHQIYNIQKFGGISRYFNELINHNDPKIKVSKIDYEPVEKQITTSHKANLLQRGIGFLNRKLHISTPPKKDTGVPSEISGRLLQRDYDIFHPTYYDPYFLDLIKTPFVITVYDMIHEIYREYIPFADKAAYNKKILCDKADHIIAISENTKKDLIDILDIPEEKITTILLASSFNASTPEMPAQIAELSLNKYILFVGSRAIYKNFYSTLTALSDILKNDKQLSLLCTGHPFSEEELQLFREMGIDKQMKHVFIRNDNEFAWVYSNAALFIFPSLYEGFGFPLLEAFACNCPVISSIGGSLPEIAGNAAIYFEPKNLKQIKDAAKSVLYNTNLREEMIEKGMERLKNFSWEKCQKETFEVYQKVLLNQSKF